MSDIDECCSVCFRRVGINTGDDGTPPVDLGRCAAPGGFECRASLSSQVESMAMRIESLAEELAKPEDARLREVLDALEGRAVIFDGLGARVGHLLDEMDEWIGRAGEAERAVEAAQRRLACVADDMTEHAYQELASALEAPPRVADRTTDFDPPGGTVGDALGLRGR